MRLTALSFCLLLALASGLSACGLKPNKMEPPEGVAKDAYPRVYPDLKNDPQPERPATP